MAVISTPLIVRLLAETRFIVQLQDHESHVEQDREEPHLSAKTAV